VKTRQMRDYNYHCGGHFLGYINQVNKADTARDSYYEQGDLIGKTGVERKYEAALRGIKGSRTVLMDNFSRELGTYADGKYDVTPEQGQDILLTIDAELQLFGEKLMQNKRGSVVAIEPSSGEILAFISAPSYDPSLLTGSNLGKNYNAMKGNDSLIPLLNRPLTAQYSPGSVFKILQALASLSEGFIGPDTRFSCGGAWFRNNGKPGCHGAHGAADLNAAIVHSCNAYFAENYYQFLNNAKFGGDVKKAYARWHEIMSTYGVGHTLGVDIPDEKPGNLPRVEDYDKKYKGRWGALTVYSNSIGQGEVLMTPLQMANTAALVANRGYYVVPHFVKAQKPLNGVWDYLEFPKVVVPNKPSDFDMIINGMEQVVKGGTGTLARLDSIVVCGKTGTVENPPYQDHAVFICFAPKENPTIAVAVIVENAGFGGTWAAPIASMMIEKYLTNKIKDPNREKRILDAVFLDKKIVPKK
jgi:penicillin-binding protein 2